MKKILLFSAALAAMTLTSCNKDDAPSMNIEAQNEICAVNVASTKGYVTASAFEDTPYDSLHAAASTGIQPRTMLMSAYLTPQDTKAEAGDYFVAKTYAKGDDDKWHADPKVYWPLGGTLDFLAVSTMSTINERDITWDRDNASKEVVIYVRDSFTQDDILYSASSTKKVTTAGGTGDGDVALNFQHAQAWIEFDLKANADSLIQVKSITIEKIYKQGELTITRGTSGADVAAAWSFRGEISKDALMDDTYGVTKDERLVDPDDASKGNRWNTLGVTSQYMDMLLPEQEQQSFVMTYVLAGQPEKELTYRYTPTGSTANWEKGKKYIYTINCTINEITVTPSVTAFTNGVVTNYDPAFGGEI